MLHNEIEKREKLEAVWQKLLEKNLTAEDLKYVVKKSSFLKQRAIYKLLQENSNVDTAFWVLKEANLKRDEEHSHFLKKEAAEIILKERQEASKEKIIEMLQIICYLEDCNYIIQEAWEELKRRELSIEDLEVICKFAEHTSKINEEEIWRMIVIRNPDDEKLVQLIEDSFFPKSEEAWEELLKRSEINKALCSLIKKYKKKEEAWEELKERGATEGELKKIIKEAHDSFPEKAAKELANKYPTEDNLVFILKEIRHTTTSGEEKEFPKEVGEKLLEKEPSYKILDYLRKSSLKEIREKANEQIESREKISLLKEVKLLNF